MTTEESSKKYMYMTLMGVIIFGVVFCMLRINKAYTEISTNFVDPLVTSIITSSGGSDYQSDSHSFYRLVVRNTEYEPCLALERITHYKEVGPQVLGSQDLCAVFIDGNETDLNEAQAVEYGGFSWDKDGLFFDMNISLARSPDSAVKCEVEISDASRVMCMSN
jgi:hypothetical protein